jgi:RND family efflux transporter MFP subunit
MNCHWIIAVVGTIAMVAGSLYAESSDQPLIVPNCRIGLVRRASLAGSRQGIVQTIAVTEGEVVEKGQLIASLKDDVPRQTLALAEKEMANTVDIRLHKKISELATLEYSKAMELNRSIPGGFSDLDIKKLRLAAEKAVLQIEQADFQQQMATLRKKEAEVTLESYRITAPFPGVVLQVSKQPGEALGAGEMVVEIANFDTMRVEGFIPVATSQRVQRGDTVVVEVPGVEPQKQRRFEGQIKHIAPIINEVSQEVRVWAEVTNRRDLLKDGLPATMFIRARRNEGDDVAAERTQHKN